MRKVIVVALREYNAAVRTKAFLIGLLIMPVMMGGSILAQGLLSKYRDTKERQVAVVDRTANESLLPALSNAVKEYNQKSKDRPTFKLVKESLGQGETVADMRFRLSERVRANELAGFLEIGPQTGKLGAKDEASEVRFQSNRLTERDFPNLAQNALSEAASQARAAEAKVPPQLAREIVQPVVVQSKGLSVRDESGKVGDVSEKSRVASFAAPIVLMMLMFMLILMTATPLMQGVVEEKMQRIAEVLLGSVSPFQLMLGKLIGMTGVSLTIAAVYLGGAYWAAHHFEVAEHVSLELLGWFVFYQTLASLMYGALFIAVGAACTDLRETQNLMWPVMLLAVTPMFVLGNVIREPNSAVVTALSFFPFATPTLMIGRQSLPPGVPGWQPAVAGAGVVLTTLVCIWVAGRIFRVGILLQGKGANPVEIARWVVRG